MEGFGIGAVSSQQILSSPEIISNNKADAVREREAVKKKISATQTELQTLQIKEWT